MRNTRWLRYGLGSFSLAAAAMAAFLVACGDDDNGGGVKPTDGGPGGDTGPGVDSGGGTDAGDAGPKVPPAKLQLVNAAVNFGSNNPVGALRVCYAALNAEGKEIVVGLPPLPETSPAPAPFAGLYIGTGGNVPGTGGDLSGTTIVPYIMNAQALYRRGIVKPASGPSTSCSELLKADVDAGAFDGGGPLVANVDYWKLPPIPAGTLQKDKSYILVLTGCTTDSTAVPPQKCGPDFNPGGGGAGVGNLKVTVHEVDRATAIAADKIGTQFIHASSAGDLVVPQVTPGYMKNPNDSNSFTSVADGGGADGGVVPYGGKTSLVQISGVDFTNDHFTVMPLNAQLAIPLPIIQQASYGANVPDGGAYRNGAAFTFIAVGDPQETGAGNSKVFHYIALPNDPQAIVFGQ